MACFFLPAGARFVLAAGMRPAVFLVFLATYSWVSYLFGVFCLAVGVLMFAEHTRQRKR